LGDRYLTLAFYCILHLNQRKKFGSFYKSPSFKIHIKLEVEPKNVFLYQCWLRHAKTKLPFLLTFNNLPPGQLDLKHKEST